MYLQRLFLLFIICLFLLIPTLIEWWLQPGSAWYRPFLIWFGLIIITAILEYRRRDHEV